ncbi:multiple antibiotic resistance protein [Mesonia hippocampi]|uniref:UPF0056 membrane protein n=1 Tax=Mesonia hippocampi TaxID=1628250 RepID=A0A840EJ05_9FLAO|nr:MarC family protein [Mesonia hippocampi]MBB4119332.1 multiple antibiotic resistance protein [Mesonia hippocampi]
MTFDFKQIFTATMVLFAVIDIIGSIPVIISLRKKSGKINSAWASLISAIVLILFLFLGERILSVIGVNVKEFAVAGAMVLFFLALEMVLGITLFKQSESNLNSATVFPIAFPIVAGPGSLTTLLSLRAEYDVHNIIMAIVINIIIVFVVLKTSDKLQKILGNNGIAIIEKIFGVILLAISVKLFTTNIRDLF